MFPILVGRASLANLAVRTATALIHVYIVRNQNTATRTVASASAPKASMGRNTCWGDGVKLAVKIVVNALESRLV